MSTDNPNPSDPITSLERSSKSYNKSGYPEWATAVLIYLLYVAAYQTVNKSQKAALRTSIDEPAYFEVD
jgi:hypothetical protein